MDLDKVFAEIDGDPTLSEQERLQRKAKAITAYRRIMGRTESVRAFKNKTSIGGTFARSAARSFGSNLIRALFRAFR